MLPNHNEVSYIIVIAHMLRNLPKEVNPPCRKRIKLVDAAADLNEVMQLKDPAIDLKQPVVA